MKKRIIELQSCLAAVVALNALAGCGSQADGATGEDGSGPSPATAVAPPGHLDPARTFTADAATEPVPFVSTPDDGTGRPISDELRAKLEAEFNANPSQQFDQKTLKGGAAFTVSFGNNVEVDGQVLASASTHICYLAAIGNSIRHPDNPEFFVMVDSGGDIVAYKDAGPLAMVRCVPRDFFTASLGAKPHQNTYNYDFLWDQCGYFQGNSGYQGNVVEMLTGLGYDYAGTTDTFRILQGNDSHEANQMSIEQRKGACRGVGFTAPVAFNTPSVTFEGPNGVGTASAVGEFAYSTRSSLDQPLLRSGAPVSALDSECYFSSLGGSFGGPADLAGLYLQNNEWRLSLLATTGGVSARVRCVRHIQ